MDVLELEKLLKHYTDERRPYSIEVRIEMSDGSYVRAQITGIDSDEDGIYIEAEE